MMDFTLHLAREVKVNIRFLIALKAEEGFKRDFVAVALHRRSAFRAVFSGKVKA